LICSNLKPACKYATSSRDGPDPFNGDIPHYAKLEILSSATLKKNLLNNIKEHHTPHAAVGRRFLSPLYDSASRLPLPVIINASELPLNQPGWLTIS